MPVTSDKANQNLVNQQLQKFLVDCQDAPLAELSPKAHSLKPAPSPNTLQLHFCCQSQHQHIETSLSEIFEKVQVGHKIKRHQIQPGAKGIANIKNIVAVGSGKGGVGKSSVSVGLAQAFAHEGARVGLLDADIYGPSLPTMLGVQEKPTSPDGKSMNPIEFAGVKTISIGYLTEGDTPMIWRGPIVTNTLKQLLSETNWGELDYLIIDLPPGTGDIQLTLAQHIPVTAALVVTTPQNVALADAQKAIRMFERVNIHVLGVIENMSYFCCPHCHQDTPIFGQGGGNRLAESYQSKLLAQFPLDESLGQLLDRGDAISKSPKHFKRFQQLVWRVGYEISTRPVDFTAKMPSVQVTNLTK